CGNRQGHWQCCDSRRWEVRVFTIERNGKLFTIESSGIQASQLYIDEALRVIGTIIFGSGRFPNLPGDQWREVTESIRVEESSSSLWGIFHSDGSYARQLDDGECLYFIVCWLMRQPLPWGGFKEHQAKLEHHQ